MLVAFAIVHKSMRSTETSDSVAGRQYMKCFVMIKMQVRLRTASMSDTEDPCIHTGSKICMKSLRERVVTFLFGRGSAVRSKSLEM